MPAARAASTRAIIRSSGPRPANMPLDQALGSGRRAARANRARTRRRRRRRVSSRRSSASASPSPRNSSRTVSGSRPSRCRTRRSWPDVRSSGRRRSRPAAPSHVLVMLDGFPHMLPRVSEEADERGAAAPEGIDRTASAPGSRRTSRRRAAARLRADLRRPLEPDLLASPTPAGRRWALRRPPLGKGSARRTTWAASTGRLRARPDARCRSPPIVGFCNDESVNGAPFYVMDFVEGPILRRAADAEAFPDEDDRRAIGERVVDTLVDDPRRRPRRGRPRRARRRRRTTSPAS